LESLGSYPDGKFTSDKVAYQGQDLSDLV